MNGLSTNAKGGQMALKKGRKKQDAKRKPSKPETGWTVKIEFVADFEPDTTRQPPAVADATVLETLTNDARKRIH